MAKTHRNYVLVLLVFPMVKLTGKDISQVQLNRKKTLVYLNETSLQSI